MLPAIPEVIQAQLNVSRVLPTHSCEYVYYLEGGDETTDEAGLHLPILDAVQTSLRDMKLPREGR